MFVRYTKNEHLLSFVTDDAFSTVKGLSLSNSNYSVAMDLLTERFGDKQVSTHMSKLLELKSVISINDTKNLRSLYDEIETQVRSLNCLGINSNSYGPMLVPVLMGELPEELKLIISRQLGKNIWDVQVIIELFRKELEAREKIYVASETKSEQLYSGSSFYASGNSQDARYYSGNSPNDRYYSPSNQNYNRNNYSNNYNGSRNFRSRYDNGKSFRQSDTCIFCGRNHISGRCDIITKTEFRKDILFKEKKCFVCMKFGHVAQKCRTEMKCFKCKGRHI